MPDKTPGDNPVIPFIGGKCDLLSIVKLEQYLLNIEGADKDGGDLEHYFSDGLYARKLTLPKGAVIVGEMHLQGQINFLMKGTIAVTTDDGVKLLHAPQIVVSSAGTKRAGHAITEVEWVTVCATEEKTPEAAKEVLIATGLDDPRLEGILCLSQQ